MAMSAVGMGERAKKRGIDRYEKLICEVENPRPILVVLRSEVPLSEDAGRADLSEASSEVMYLLSAAVVVTCGVGTSCCVGLASGARGRLVRESGSRTFFSLIIMTILSRSSRVVCRLRLRLRLWTEFCR